MRRVSMVFVAWVTAGLAVVVPHEAAASEAVDEVMALEELRMTAMIEADDEALGRLLAEDLTYAHSNGVVQGKHDLIASLVEARFDYESIDVEEAQARVYGKAAVVTGIAVAAVVARDQRVRLRLRYTSVYTKRDAGWQMVAYQSTRLALVE